MTDEKKTEEAPEKVIVSQGHRPCGCYEIKYEDGSTEVQPCPPHAIMEAARLFMQAGNMLGSVGQSLLQAQSQEAERAMAEAVNKSVGDGKAKGPTGIVT